MDTKKAPIQADTRKSTSLLKKYLLETYGIKTSVRSEFYSMGCSLNISYTLGPDSGVIENVCKNLQYGGFDGMTDCSYTVECSGLVVDGYKLEEFKHVFVRQECSNDFEIKLCQFAFSKIKFGDLLPPADWSDYCAYKPEVFGYSQGSNSLSNLFYRYFRVWNFATQDENKINLLECHFSEQTNGTIYFIYECDGVVYNTEEVPTIGQKESKSNDAPEYEKMEVKAGEVQIIDYSDKAIAVIGDTKPIKDVLKSLGGRFNFRLSCGPGWIFPKSSLQKIQKALNSGNDPEPEPDNTPEPTKPQVLMIEAHKPESAPEEPKTTLKEEKEKMVHFFEATDLEIYGEVLESTKQIAEVQKVELKSENVSFAPPQLNLSASTPQQIQLILF